MPNVITEIAPRYDADGNYHVEVTADDGSTFEVLLPPKMEFRVRTVIQENEARRAAGMSGLFGYMVLEMTNVRAADTAGTKERILMVETKQLGLWGLRLTEPLAQELFRCLDVLFLQDRPDDPVRH